MKDVNSLIQVSGISNEHVGAVTKVEPPKLARIESLIRDEKVMEFKRYPDPEEKAFTKDEVEKAVDSTNKILKEEHNAKYQFETNFFGLVKCVNACLKQFRAQKSGKIISISSVAAMVPIPYQVFYSASKSAVLMFSKGLAMELKPWGIQCCCILPGDTKTGFTHARHYTAMAQNENSIYHASMTKALKKMEKDYIVTGKHKDRKSTRLNSSH